CCAASARTCSPIPTSGREWESGRSVASLRRLRGLARPAGVHLEMTTAWRALVPLVLVAVACDGTVPAKGAASPWVCIDVVHSGKNVDFYALIVAADRRVVPVDIDSLWLVMDENPQGINPKAIWTIRADDYTRATHIRYGETPEGFEQKVPSSGSPPELTPG